MDIFRMNHIAGRRVVIDGKEFSGSSFSIGRDGVVVIDGVAQEGTLVGPVNVTVHGDASHVETVAGRVEITGSAGSVKTMSGDVRCGAVSGSVSTMSGDVTADSIAGGASSMSGDIRGVR